MAGKALKFDCGDIFVINEEIFYSINQVLYDCVKKAKLKHGVELFLLLVNNK